MEANKNNLLVVLNEIREMEKNLRNSVHFGFMTKAEIETQVLNLAKLRAMLDTNALIEILTKVA